MRVMVRTLPLLALVFLTARGSRVPALQGGTLTIEQTKVSSVYELNPLRAILRDPGGGSIDVTRSTYCRWASSDPTVAVVSNERRSGELLGDGEPTRRGVVTFLKRGGVTITATFGTFSASLKMTCSDRWTPRDGAGAVAYRGRLYLLGGYLRRGVRSSDVFATADGKEWEEITPKAAWRERSLHGTVEFRDRMFVLGGVSANADASFNDVWSSSDGGNWTLVTGKAGWSGRAAFGHVVFRSRLWVIGGIASSGNARTYFSDVWSSEDGRQWTQDADHPGWGSRAMFDAVVFGDRMWIIGGQDAGGKNCSDAWSTEDGKEWHKESDVPLWIARYYHRAVAYRGRLLLIAGMDAAHRSRDDVWSSRDGRNWTLIAEGPWAGRIAPSVTIFNDQLWLIGGSRPGAGGAEQMFNDVWRSQDATRWERVRESWTPRDSMASVVYEEKIVLTGGWFDGSERANDVFSSTDGMNWRTLTSSAPWKPRNAHAAIAFANGIWIFGGASTWRSGEASVEHDVWSSPDGRRWDLVTQNAGWSARAAFGEVVYKGKLWVMGGFFADRDDRSCFNDVWSSANGALWMRETDSAGWSARGGFDAVVFKDRMWIVGGRDSLGRNCGDVWSSADGHKWTREVALAPWQGRHFHRAVVLKEKLYLIAGVDDAERNCNDVWSSADGRAWTVVTRNAPWPARHEPSVVVYKDHLWLFGGLGDQLYNDVWASANGGDWQLIRPDDSDS